MSIAAAMTALRAHVPRNLTLRTKGMVALTIMVVYVGSIAGFLASQRNELFAIGQQIESHLGAQDLLAPSFNRLAHTLVQTQRILSAPDYVDGPKSTYAEIGLSLDPLMERLQPLRDLDRTLAPHIIELQQAVDDVRSVPSGRNLSAVRDAEQVMIAHLNDRLASLQHRIDVLESAYRDKQRLIGITAIGTSILGALASAAVILIFFTRLARDVARLQERAVSIVSGYSGPPLVNRRRDEIGGLIEAVNLMQVDLRRWEQQQEIGRQQRFHQEKMAAVGSMAAAIGHEVSNPIAAIAGISQYLIDETTGDDHRTSKLAHNFSVQILRQTERISLIMRQLANLTRPHSPEPELLDLNALVQSTGNFISFDKRFRGIDFEYELDHNMPAVRAVADHMTQVLMNLLINAADALEETPNREHARIRVSTQVVDGEIVLSIADTGHGMTPEVVARAFEESFTTKAAGKGRGIGLFLCKTLVEQSDGRIELSSTPGVGTRVSLYLPIGTAARAEA